MALQPRIVFSDEMTRVNDLYWTSSYSFNRVAAILTALSSVGYEDADPRVDRVWPSINAAENRRLTVPASQFQQRLDGLLASLRTTSILHACSAFENCLSAYFALCLLYRPSAVNALRGYQPVPAVMRTPADYEKLKLDAVSKAESIVKGGYGQRLNEFTRFGISPPASPAVARLDRYYDDRNRVAHDQGLNLTDNPEYSSEEILASRLTVDENTWKQMLADFGEVIGYLDAEIGRTVVTDGGMVVAVHRVVSRGGPTTIAKVIDALATEWHMDTHKRGAVVRQAIIDAGCTIKQASRRRDDKVSL